MGNYLINKNFHMKTFIATIPAIAVIAAEAEKKDAAKPAAAAKQITDKVAIKACADAKAKTDKPCAEALKTETAAFKKKEDSIKPATGKSVTCMAPGVKASTKCMTAGSVTLMAGAAFVATAAVLF